MSLPDLPPRTSGERADLRRLVDETRGLQPWRRVFHAVNGLLIAGAVGLLAVPRSWAAAVLGGVFVLLLAGDALRLRVSRLNAIFFRFFRALASPREESSLASSTWYVGGVALTLALFPLPAALAGILILALADPAASYVGRRWGRRALGAGTVEGTLTFLGVGVLAAWIVLPPSGAAMAAALATAVEPIPWRLDDNVTVPVAGALGAWLLGLI